MIARLKYIQKFMDHNGHTRVYLRRKGHKPIPLPDLKDPKFFLAYQTALASTAPPEKKIKVDPASLDALVDGYYKTAKFCNSATARKQSIAALSGLYASNMGRSRWRA